MMRWQKRKIQIKESILTVMGDSQGFTAAEKAVRETRAVLEGYIDKNPAFPTTLSPFTPEPGAPDIIRAMCHETRRMNVGPMASVAGTVALKTAEALLAGGSGEAVVDNGGDIVLKVDQPLLVGLFAGHSSLKNLALKVTPRPGLLAICTSSGTVGPSFSAGQSDAGLVISSNALLADAAATALGNRIRGEADLTSCFDFLDEFSEIEGALAVLGDKIAMWGDLPELVKADVNEELITQGN